MCGQCFWLPIHFERKRQDTKAASLLLKLDERVVQRLNISFTANKRSQFSLSLVLISLSGYCIFCSPHATAVALRTSEIMLGPNPGNHFGVISLGTAHPTHILFSGRYQVAHVT